jgi:hypothetical protein
VADGEGVVGVFAKQTIGAIVLHETKNERLFLKALLNRMII